MSTAPEPQASVDAGTYDVLRDRLAAHAAELARRAEDLNTRRAQEFGSTRLALASTTSLKTPHATLRQDIVAVGDRLLLGSRARGSEPVLALYDRDGNRLPEDDGFLDDPAFVREFTALTRYYRDAHLLRLRRTDGRLLAVFRTGEKADDIRALRWTLTEDGRAEFLDARGDRDDVVPPAQDVTWTDTGRADHVLGREPYVAVPGGLGVAALGGTLTVRAEDGTELYAEPVEEPLQSLADAAVAYTRVGPLTLLRVRPYKEDTDRYLVFNALTRTVVRLDGLGQACRRLPEEQGVVFPGGYCLASGRHKAYELDVRGLEFEQEIRAPNGEDVLYAFRDRSGGGTLLLSYNTLRKEVATPLSCQGWALFEDGALAVLRAGGDEPAHTHPVQWWTSPYVSDTHAAALRTGTGPLARVGNADLVRGLADCLSVARLVADGITTGEGYRALTAACVRAADTHHWLTDPELGSIQKPLAAVRETAEQVLAEFETVRALTRQAAEALDEAAERIAAVVRRVRGEAPREAAAWVRGLTELRRAHGHLLTLRELRHVDAERLATLAAEAESDLAAFGRRAVAFLSREDAFTAQRADVEQLVADADAIRTVADAVPVAERLDELADGLRTVTEVVTGLDIADATVRTAVLERIADVLGGVNRARATLEGRRRALQDQEGRAEFAAETALLAQAVTAALAGATTPEACDDQLATVLARLEDLDGRFAEFDDFLTELAGRRTEIYEAFAARKQSLADVRARRAEQLAVSAGRMLETVARRAAGLPDADAVTACFASDPLVTKIVRIAGELRGLGDSVRAEELDGRLKAARQEAARALRDRGDLYADDGRTLLLGGHRFAVNTQPLDLALVPAADGLALAVTGTDYRAPVTDPGFAATRPYWDRHLPSESPGVYRAEHLAARLLTEHGPAALAAADDLPGLVRRVAQESYDEGYERGVHDHDATLILTALLPLYDAAGPLRHEPAARARAQLFWTHGTTEAARTAWTRRAVSLARARDAFGPTAALGDLVAELAAALGEWERSETGDRTGGERSETGDRTGGERSDSRDRAGGERADSRARSAGERSDSPERAGAGPDRWSAEASAAYLLDELTGGTGPEGFVLGAAARALLDKFRRALGGSDYGHDLEGLTELRARRQVVEAWLTAYATASGSDAAPGELAEAVAAELCPALPRYDGDARLTTTVEGLLGAHPRVAGGRLELRLDEFLARTARHTAHDVPGFRAYQRRRSALLAAERERLRLADHRPRVMPAFVRNRLVDEVYLPLIGDSLARQLGTTGAGKRTDTGGLLLLVSPPGYGKTTLMEYVADRLGLMLVKISGPALGHSVTSLDPADAPNATARREIEKINFALAAGNNTLLHLDDIQHTSPELLQKFIPLCDATRRVDGVWDGEPRTYDLRGKRFAVCMAGNPYTESGERFRIPDMLANRADVWNLGDVLTGKEDVFALSFVENALTANPVLAPLAARERADLDLLVRLAAGDPTARPDRLSTALAPTELDAVLALLRHVLAVRDTVLTVNAAYIASAAQSADARTEPPFRLQGSYRDMNKITQRLRPVMNTAERDAVVRDHYTAEAQTLTTGAEANLLKLAELRDELDSARSSRWTEIKSAHIRTRTLGGPENDPLTRAVAALTLLADRVAAVESAIVRAVRTEREGTSR
ncbi:DNA repair ATPase [Streptomyces sp. WP-1]|uniref:DNA repair ATPase n=1 Tax=Streptomyces sp. WP-1 TaxID=3041497 RepID=UPI002647B6D0|nr:DNA repair ATPase [Streptomyces sp. WP-1]WKE70613.1 DNA repair ATPase [Streptomyces sp. WP-1]